MRITRRETIAGAACSAIGVPAYVPRRTPNIVFIHTDQQFAGTISAHGCPHVRTPTMDRLAARGISFHESYSADPVCCPARSAWYTGRPPSENGVVRNDSFPLEASMPDLGQWFSGRGYDAVYAGKWHIPARTQTYRIIIMNATPRSVDCVLGID